MSAAGHVAIQGDPRVNGDSDAILDGASRYRELGENIIVKVPATPAGAHALKELTSMNVPTIATLGFSVDQAVYMAEAYRKAAERSGRRPPCYVTFIAGILDECLAEDSERLGHPVPPDWVEQAGRDYYDRANRETAVILQIEGTEGIANLDSILETPHLDCIFIGPYDLSQSMGMPGAVTDDRVLDAMKDIVQRAAERGIAMANFPVTIDQAKRYRDIGVRFLAFGTDTLVLQRAYRDCRKEILGE